MNFAAAKEMSPYLEEPKAMPVGTPGKMGYLFLGFELDDDGRSIMRDLERHAPLIVQQELYFDEGMPEMPCVYILSSGGPNVDGDRYEQRFVVREGAYAHISTGAATKLAVCGHAPVSTPMIRSSTRMPFSILRTCLASSVVTTSLVITSTL